mmetsp:Transcript_55386/g.177695  ORF Transcript_55386/g.177695 Transcript_55386/m.177695 type:complete len:210 (+) Transcript_55386:278-907(+)
MHEVGHRGAVVVARRREDGSPRARSRSGEVIHNLLAVLLGPLPDCLVELALWQPQVAAEVPINRKLVVLRVAQEVGRADEGQPERWEEALPAKLPGVLALAFLADQARGVEEGRHSERLVLEGHDSWPKRQDRDPERRVEEADDPGLPDQRAGHVVQGDQCAPTARAAAAVDHEVPLLPKAPAPAEISEDRVDYAPSAEVELQLPTAPA